MVQFVKPSWQQEYQIYRKDDSSKMVLLKLACLTNFQEKMWSEGKNLLFAVGHLNQFFLCYSRLNTKHEMLENTKSNATHIQTKPPATQGI